MAELQVEGDPEGDPSCIFCKIIAKEKEANVVFENSEFVCFTDHKPASTHHYLVVPRQHLRDPKSLTSEHIPVVEKMVGIGKEVLTSNGGTLEDARLGFHWPPFVLVRHLHLHVIAPTSAMGWFSRSVIFRENSFAFVTPGWLVDHLK